MPRVTQYIRDEDLDKWNSINNKSEWISKHLKESSPAYKEPMVFKKPQEVLGTLKPDKACKHGFPPEFCKFSKLVNGKKVCK